MRNCRTILVLSIICLASGLQALFGADDAPSKKAPEGSNLLSSMQGDTSRVDADGAIVLTGNERIHTPNHYAAPVKFEIVAQTDSTNIRIGYAADQIIFDWEKGPSELRIDGGPANGRNVKGVGYIEPKKWAKIELTVLPDLIKIDVNGKNRYTTRADFSHVDMPLSIFPANGSTIKVKLVKMTIPNQ